MGELGGLYAKRLEELEVLRGVHHVILAADHVGHLHFDVIHDVDEMEDVGAVAAFHDHVGRVRLIAVIDGHIPADEIVDGDRFAVEAETPGIAVLVEAVGGEELFEIGVVDVVALGLVVRAVRPAFFRPLIPVEAEPVHAVEDRLAGCLGVAGGIGVLDAEDERAFVLTGEEPVEKGGAGAADVEVAGGGGGETGADHKL